MQKEPVRTIITMPKVFFERYGSGGVSIARRSLSGPVAESRPISALPELAISSDIAAPRIQKAISRSTHHILSQTVKAVH